ncbi:MAG: hypothetical protein KDC44_25215 [Phaeodactylibacter sp.]|nr:hypothetical protein [Phaeodactylibacter sp.]
MKSLLHPMAILFGLLVVLPACKKETTIIQETVYDNEIFEVTGQAIYQTNADKTKQKTTEQYISILFTNLYQVSIGQNVLADLAELRLATGDKQLADELILNNFINSGTAVIPTNAEMRADIETFVRETFIRFFLREPNAYELFELKTAIEEDPGLTPELIYQGFALSNEYKFY